MDENKTDSEKPAGGDMTGPAVNSGVMSHGPKVITPSADFEDEIKNEQKAEAADATAEPESENPENHPDENNSSETSLIDNPSSEASANLPDSEPAEPKETPQAVQDFINSNNLSDVAPATPDAAAAVNAAAVNAPEAPTETPAVNAPLTSTAAPAAVNTPLAQPQAPANMPLTTGGDNSHPNTGEQMLSGEPPRGKKRLILGAIAMVVIIIIALAVYAFGFYLPDRPDNVVKQGLANMLAAKSINYAGDMNVNDTQDKMNFDVTLNGAVANDGKFDAKINADVLVTKLGLELLSPDGQNYYVKLSGLDGLPQLLSGLGGLTDPSDQAELKQIEPLIKDVNNHWFVIDKSLIEKLTGQDLSKVLTLSNSDQSKIKKAYLNHPFLVIQKVLPSQQVDSVDSFHYQVVVNKSKLVAFAQEIKNDNLSNIKITQSEIDDLNKEKASDFSKQPFELWISKGKKQIDQFAITANDSGASETFKLGFSNYNQPVNVTAPKHAESILQLVGQFSSLFGTYEGEQSQAQNADQQTTVAETQVELDSYAADNLGKYPSTQQVFDSWLRSSPDGDKTLASQFTAAKGFTYKMTSGGQDYVITYKTSSGTQTVTSNSTPGGDGSFNVSL